MTDENFRIRLTHEIKKMNEKASFYEGFADLAVEHRECVGETLALIQLIPEQLIEVRENIENSDKEFGREMNLAFAWMEFVDGLSDEGAEL